MEELLRVENLGVDFFTERGRVTVLEDISFGLNAEEVLGVVGESGCGKTVSALSVIRLLPPAAQITHGAVFYRRRNLLQMDQRQLREIRGGKIGMIFQEPLSALNPLYTIGYQIKESLRYHHSYTRDKIERRAAELLELMEMPSPEQRLADYPHQLSGGMRQRAMIAMALAGDPDILIADEPTTAQDVTIQAQIIKLFQQIRQKTGLSIILITHNLAIVANIAQRICIMYLGRIVEQGTGLEVVTQPRHPYTEGLIKAVKGLETPKSQLMTIPGSVPDPAQRPDGCPFHPRCEFARDECRRRMPEWRSLSSTHKVRCFKAGSK
jgi:oligopeptide/dipeptide ABC transporter ATP-binding protein